jgi:transketolase
MATRASGGQLFAEIAEKVPGFIGGSADLAGSTKTVIEKGRLFSVKDRTARDLAFGIREHAMGAAVNGMAIHGGLKPYGATFFVFSDYMRASLRLSALMGAPSIWVYTHDSIFLGEDGPTHQPISQLAALRAIPRLTVLRPADANETVAAWRVALGNRRGPTALALTRQKLPISDETTELARDGVPRGAYVLADPEPAAPEAILIATGSEVALALESHRELIKQGIPTRVVSMPSWELFAQQSRAYRDQVLPPALKKRLAIEAGSPVGWHRWVGLEGDVMGLERFGASAPYKDLARAFGFIPEEVVRRIRWLLGMAG